MKERKKREKVRRGGKGKRSTPIDGNGSNVRLPPRRGKRKEKSKRGKRREKEK